MPAYLDTPSEIWHKIFEIATEEPDPLVCFVQDYHGTRRDVTRPPYQRYKESSVGALSPTCCFDLFLIRNQNRL